MTLACYRANKKHIRRDTSVIGQKETTWDTIITFTMRRPSVIGWYQKAKRDAEKQKAVEKNNRTEWKNKEEDSHRKYEVGIRNIKRQLKVGRKTLGHFYFRDGDEDYKLFSRISNDIPTKTWKRSFSNSLDARNGRGQTCSSSQTSSSSLFCRHRRRRHLYFVSSSLHHITLQCRHRFDENHDNTTDVFDIVIIIEIISKSHRHLY